MKQFVLLFSALLIGLSVFAQSEQPKSSSVEKNAKQALDTDKNKSVGALKRAKRKKMILVQDTLTMSDYVMSIERVNDNLNAIKDSVTLGFEMVGMGRRIDDITGEVSIIRQNIRNKNSVLNIRSLYLYQSFASELSVENTKIQSHLIGLYKRVYHAKLRMKTLLSDSVFHRLYVDSSLRNVYDEKLDRLERKFAKTDSTTRANIDSLNKLKVKTSDNSINLSNMLNSIANRLDKAGQHLFEQELNPLWQKAKASPSIASSSSKTLSPFSSEQKKVVYYFGQTIDEKAPVLIFGILLFIWLFYKRKLFMRIKQQKESFDFLHLHYMDKFPVLSLFVFLLCLMPFFDAYAPTSYIAIEYVLALAAASVIFVKKKDKLFLSQWLVLVGLYLIDTLSYLFMDPTMVTRVWLLALHLAIIVFLIRFNKRLSKHTAYFKWQRSAVIVGIITTCLAVICNLFGRVSLSGLLGIAGIFAVAHAIVLPIFIETFLEIILLQLESSRLKKGIHKPFDTSIVTSKIRGPLSIVALLLWLIMFTSNLNIYHNMSIKLINLLTSRRTIGNITFELDSILMFFVIIWFAHLMQRMISFLFGETGSDDTTQVTKGQHSRLLITRLLVLIGGYLLAVAASGLPIDKLTFLLGALGVGIGMGLQNVVNNFVSGIILIFDGSLQIGDEIEISGQAGKVKEIGLRASTLNTADGADVIIPNGHILSQNIVNWTFSNDQKRVVLEFSVIGNELDANIINEVINTTIKNIQGIVPDRNPMILYTKVTARTCAITVKFWCLIHKADSVKSEGMLKLSAAFIEKGIRFR